MAAVVDDDRYSLFVTSVQGGVLRTLFEVLKDVIHDVCFQFDEDGVKLLTMDGTRCALIYVKLHASKFERYHCPSPIRAGIDMEMLFKLVKTCGNNDTLSLFMEKADWGEMGIRISVPDRNSLTEFRLKLLDIDTEMMPFPDVPFDSIITIPSTS